MATAMAFISVLLCTIQRFKAPLAFFPHFFQIEQLFASSTFLPPSLVYFPFPRNPNKRRTNRPSSFDVTQSLAVESPVMVLINFRTEIGP